MKGFMDEAYELLEASGQTSLKRLLVNIAAHNGLTSKYKWLNDENLIHVHHIDLNHDNNDVHNLSLIHRSKHTGLHNKLRSPKITDKVDTAKQLHEECVSDNTAFPVINLLTEFIENINSACIEDEQTIEETLEKIESQTDN